MVDTSAITAQLQGLLAYPREELDIELKGWLDLSDAAHKAALAKALIALTNHGGGHVVVGFREAGGNWDVDPNRPRALETFNQDAINGIVADYAEPVFHCRVHMVDHPVTKELYPVIVVPGIIATPVRSRRDGPHDIKGRPAQVNINTYYIRRPGPKSQAPQTGQEWDLLIRRCVRASSDELLSTISGFFEGIVPFQSRSAREPLAELKRWTAEAEDRRLALIKSSPQAEIYKHGLWRCSYILTGKLKKPSLAELLIVLRGVEGHETGWPPWWVPSQNDISPYPIDGRIECWFKETQFQDAAHADYWLASPNAQLFLIRGYQEDSADKFPAGRIFDVALPIWRVAECLLHAQRLAAVLQEQDNDATLQIQFTWSGLKGRTLAAWVNPARHIRANRQSKQDSVTSDADVNVMQVRDRLTALVTELTRPLYNAFDFFELPDGLVSEELAKLLGRGR